PYPSLNKKISNKELSAIGNIIGGGLLVGLTYWIIYLRNPAH
ncbi:TPA: formate transporter FocA, partial [Yersinia enterocolitica]|nr:formate transporter FocA [Yersinia enterocolitica]